MPVSKVRKKKRKLSARDFSKTSVKTAKRYIKRFLVTILINHNSWNNKYYKSLQSAMLRIQNGY